MPHHSLFPLLLAFALPLSSFAKEAPSTTATAPHALAKTISRIVDGAIEKNQLAGAVVAVSRDGEIVHLSAHGAMDRENAKPMREDAIFRIFSMTKAITTAAAMMLVEEGAFALDDPIAQHIPELTDLKVYHRDGNIAPARQPTVRDLMRHTSGLAYGFFGDGPVDRLYRERHVMNNAGTLRDMIDKLSDIPLLYAPGDDWAYSAAIDVLGYLVEIKSGVSLDVFFEDRIFTPLEMTDTGFFVPEEKRDRFAASYVLDAEKGLVPEPLQPWANTYLKPPTFVSGGGGLVSTTRDYMRFLQMIANGGEFSGRRLLKKASVRQMTRNQVPPRAMPIAIGGERPGVGFGLGFSVRTETNKLWDPAARLNEYGWAGAASTHYWVSPDDNVIVVTMEQTKPYSFLLEFALKGPIYDALRK